MSKEDTKEHKEFLKKQKKKDRDLEKERKKNKESKRTVSPILT